MMAEWECGTCGYVYSEEAGDPAQGVAPGTLWAGVPDEWRCPMCGTKKEDFMMVNDAH